MTQEDKQLLLQDLCARLPYGVKVKTPYNDAILIGLIKRKGFKKDEHYIDVITNKQTYPIRYIQPYLRSMSSMTEEEEEEYHSFCYSEWCSYKDGWDYHNTILSTDWLLEHHFDFRGLIERGLAIEITEVNNPYKD